eukprot:2649694-Rhodomonas_salina.2
MGHISGRYKGEMSVYVVRMYGHGYVAVCICEAEKPMSGDHEGFTTCAHGTYKGDISGRL